MTIYLLQWTDRWGEDILTLGAYRTIEAAEAAAGADFVTYTPWRSGRTMDLDYATPTALAWEVGDDGTFHLHRNRTFTGHIIVPVELHEDTP